MAALETNKNYPFWDHILNLESYYNVKIVILEVTVRIFCTAVRSLSGR